jgi:hypothetical protein
MMGCLGGTAGKYGSGNVYEIARSCVGECVGNCMSGCASGCVGVCMAEWTLSCLGGRVEARARERVGGCVRENVYVDAWGIVWGSD